MDNLPFFIKGKYPTLAKLRSPKGRATIYITGLGQDTHTAKVECFHAKGRRLILARGHAKVQKFIDHAAELCLANWAILSNGALIALPSRPPAEVEAPEPRRRTGRGASAKAKARARGRGRGRGRGRSSTGGGHARGQAKASAKISRRGGRGGSFRAFMSLQLSQRPEGTPVQECIAQASPDYARQQLERTDDYLRSLVGSLGSFMSLGSSSCVSLFVFGIRCV